jgi:hypothetical protein
LYQAPTRGWWAVNGAFFPSHAGLHPKEAAWVVAHEHLELGFQHIKLLEIVLRRLKGYW